MGSYAWATMRYNPVGTLLGAPAAGLITIHECSFRCCDGAVYDGYSFTRLSRGLIEPLTLNPKP